MQYPRAKLFNDDYTVLDDSFKIGEKKSLLHLMINVRQWNLLKLIRIKNNRWERERKSLFSNIEEYLFITNSWT